MKRIAENAAQKVIVHWISAAGLSLFALTGLIVLNAQSRLTDVWWTITAWSALTVGALWAMTTAVVEATVIADAALARNTAI
jgi:TRAP-type mannitol/chloroaromatic compound transport system permease large subunit